MDNKVNTEGEFIHSPSEIARLLNRVKDQLSPVTLRLRGVRRPLTSYIAAVDPNRKYILLDEVLPKSDAGMMQDGREFTLETYNDGCRLLGRHQTARQVRTRAGELVYRLPFPEELHYLQRRASFRARVRRTLEIPGRIIDVDRNVVTGLLRDISAEGCQIQIAGDVVERLKPHTEPVPVKLYFPNGSSLVAKVELRFVGFDERGGFTKCGCQFAELDVRKEREISRIVTDLQRDYINFTKNGGKIEGVPSLFLPAEQDDDIDRLDEAGPVDTPSTRFNDTAEQSAKAARQHRREAQEPRLDVRRTQIQAVDAVKTLVGRARLEQSLPLDELLEAAANLVTVLQQNRDNLLLSTHLRNTQDFIFEHSVSMAVLLADQCQQAGKSLSGDELRDMALAGLCHEVPRALLPESGRETGVDVSREKQAALRRNLIQFREQLKANDLVPSVVTEIVSTVFERSNGTGIPDGLHWDDLSELSRLAIAVDLIDTGAHVYREDVYYHPAISYKAALNTRDKVDPALIKKIVMVQGVYPLGAPVRLSDDTVGLVMRLDDHKRPSIVRVVYNLLQKSMRPPTDILLAAGGQTVKGPADPVHLGLSNTLLQSPLRLPDA